MTLRIRSLLFLAVPVLLILFNSGCTGSADDDVESERIQIAVIPKGNTHQFWKSIHAGAVKAAQELDVDIIWQGPQKEDDRQMQIQVAQNFISRGVDAIVLAPLDARSLVPPVEAAVRRDIPVIIIDSGLDSDVQAAFVATNNFEGGRTCARRLAELIDEDGKVIMLRYLEGSASTTAREEGFLAGLQEYAPNAVLLVENQYAGPTIEKALQASQNLLNRFAEVDGIFVANESSLQGMLRALQTSGRAGSIKLVGFDANETLIAGLTNGEIHGLVVQDPLGMAYLGVKTAVAVVKGEPYERQVDTRVMLITTDNFNTPEAQELLYPDFERWLNE